MGLLQVTAPIKQFTHNRFPSRSACTHKLDGVCFILWPWVCRSNCGDKTHATQSQISADHGCSQSLWLLIRLFHKWLCNKWHPLTTQCDCLMKHDRAWVCTVSCFMNCNQCVRQCLHYTQDNSDCQCVIISVLSPSMLSLGHPSIGVQQGTLSPDRHLGLKLCCLNSVLARGIGLW